MKISHAHKEKTNLLDVNVITQLRIVVSIDIFIYKTVSLVHMQCLQWICESIEYADIKKKSGVNNVN